MPCQLTLWILLLTLVHYLKSDEIVVGTEERLVLVGDNSSLIVIHDAQILEEILGERGGPSCKMTDRHQLRSLVSKQCSGLSECEVFMSTLQIPCRGHRVLVNYSFILADSVYKYCNPSPLTANEGYIASPGYPGYSPPLGSCLWTILGRDGQTIEIRILDINTCTYENTDLIISDGNNRLYQSCRKDEPLKTFEIYSHTLNVNYSSKSFAPHTGFLLYYKLKGCPTLNAPKNGFLVYRNGTALYRCNQGFLFNDTLQTWKNLACIPEEGWNDTISTCLSETELIETNHSLTEEHLELLKSNFSSLENTRMLKASSHAVFEDIIIPSAIIVSLLFINIIIVAIICIIRRRHKQKQKALAKEEILTLKPCSGTPTAV